MTTTPDDNDPIRTAWLELEVTMANARVALDRVRSQPVHSPDERRQLQQDAASGALGRDMQELARHVEAGRTSWGEVFEGSTEYAGLFEAHVTRMADENQEAVRQAIEADEDFDPLAPSPEV